MFIEDYFFSLLVVTSLIGFYFNPAQISRIDPSSITFRQYDPLHNGQPTAYPSPLGL